MKLSILDKIAENVDYSQNFRKMSICVKICKYFDFGQNCRQISILVNIYGNLEFGKKNHENLDFGQIYRKFRIWSVFMKISILVRVYENFGFDQNCRKILILVNISGKSRF